MEREEEDIVFIDIKDSIKDNEENNLKQRKINTLQTENNNLKYQIEDLRSELQRVKDPQMDLFGIQDLQLDFEHIQKQNKNLDGILKQASSAMSVQNQDIKFQKKQ